MARPYQPPRGKGSFSKSLLIGIATTALLFLAIPMTQLFIQYEKSSELIDTLDMAPPPPPPPLEDEPPPPPPEEELPPEFDTPPPPISLEQINMSLEPGIGSSLSGDFALPTFDVDTKNLGSLDIFDINDLENKPSPRRQGSPRYPPEARRKGIGGRVTAEFIIDENGDVSQVTIIRSSDNIFENPTIDAIRKWKFTPGEKDGRKVKTRTRITIPYDIS